MNIRPNSTVFLLARDSAPGFTTATVHEVRSRGDGPFRAITILLDHRVKRLSRGDSVALYAQTDGAFWMRPCKVTAIEPSADGTVLELKPTLDPTMAEQRHAERVDSSSHGVTASLSLNPESLVLNVSPTGFAVMTTRHYEIGDTLSAKICWNGNTWSGDATVRRSDQADREAWILGVCARGEDNELLEGLGRICATLQFQQCVLRDFADA